MSVDLRIVLLNSGGNVVATHVVGEIYVPNVGDCNSLSHYSIFLVAGLYTRLPPVGAAAGALGAGLSNEPAIL